MKKFLSVILAAIMALMSVTIMACAEFDSSSQIKGILNPGTTKIEIESEKDDNCCYYSFTAKEDGYYTFTNDRDIDTLHGAPENFALLSSDLLSSGEDCYDCFADFVRIYDKDNKCLLLTYLNKDETVYLKIRYFNNDINVTVSFEGNEADYSFTDSDTHFINGIDFVKFDVTDRVYITNFPVKISFGSGKTYTQLYDWEIKSVDFKSDKNAGIVLTWLNDVDISFDATVHGIDEYIKEVKLPEGFKTTPVKYYDNSVDSQCPEYVDVVLADGNIKRVTEDTSSLKINGKEYFVFVNDTIDYTMELCCYGVTLYALQSEFINISSDDTFSLKEANVFENYGYYLKNIKAYISDAVSGFDNGIISSLKILSRRILAETLELFNIPNYY